MKSIAPGVTGARMVLAAALGCAACQGQPAGPAPGADLASGAPALDAAGSAEPLAVDARGSAAAGATGRETAADDEAPDPGRVIAELGAIPAWQAVVDRAQLLGRRGQHGVVYGRVGPPVMVPASASPAPAPGSVGAAAGSAGAGAGARAGTAAGLSGVPAAGAAGSGAAAGSGVAGPAPAVAGASGAGSAIAGAPAVAAGGSAAVAGARPAVVPPAAGPGSGIAAAHATPGAAAAGSGAAVGGRPAGGAVAPGAGSAAEPALVATPYVWLIDDTEGNGTLGLRILLGDKARPGDRIAAGGGWQLDAEHRWYWKPDAVQPLPPAPPSELKDPPPPAPGHAIATGPLPAGARTASLARDGDAIYFQIVGPAPQTDGDGWQIADQLGSPTALVLNLPGERASYGGQDMRASDERWQLRRGQTYWVRIGVLHRRGTKPATVNARTAPVRIP